LEPSGPLNHEPEQAAKNHSPPRTDGFRAFERWWEQRHSWRSSRGRSARKFDDVNGSTKRTGFLPLRRIQPIAFWTTNVKYFTHGYDHTNREVLDGFLEADVFFTVRDSTYGKLEWLGHADAYIASPEQKEFIDRFCGKSCIPSTILVKYTDLWSDLECVWSVKLGLLELTVFKRQQHYHQQISDSGLR